MQNVQFIVSIMIYGIKSKVNCELCECLTMAYNLQKTEPYIPLMYYNDYTIT